MSKGLGPDGLVGRVGMIAALRGVKPSEVGKLVVVRMPVGMQADPRDRSRQAFQWQVLALAAPVTVDGHGCRDLVLPDDCLRPVSQVEPGVVDMLVKARALASFDEAAADLGRHLEHNPMSEEEFDACLWRAAEMAFINRALEIVPVATVLAELGFAAGEGGCSWRWTVSHLGALLTVLGGPDLFERWSLVGTCNSAKGAMWDERVLAAQEQRGKIMSIVLDFWRGAFGPSAPIPPQLAYAGDVERHQRDMRKLKFDVPPQLLADGQMLRATRNVLAQRHGQRPAENGPLSDVPMALSFDGRLLHIEVDGRHYAVEAQGVWVEDCSVSLREFLALPPQRLRRHSIRIDRNHAALGFNGQFLRAHCLWGEDSLHGT